MRASLHEQTLPNYSRGEEIFNMTSHIVGCAIGFVALLTCVIVASYNHNVWGVVSGGIYGVSVILLYAMSSIYHGLHVGLPKKVFRIIDHCTIFILIAGTYTPIVLGRFREQYPLDAWVIFGVVWGLAVFGIVLNAVAMKRFKALSMACYLGMGWCIIFRMKEVIEVLGMPLFVLLLLGGIFYTIGALLYVVGRKKKYMHSVFHIFVDIATLTHFVGIAAYVMPG